MVNLMLQPVFMNLVKGSTDHKMTSDDLYNMWSVASRAKSAIVQGRRLENLSWRLWYTSTIRAKVEMEEKQKMKNKGVNEFNSDDLLDESNCGELSSTDQYAHNNEDCSSEENSRDSDKSEKANSLVLPSDRPLFTSTCTSILAEIQDASFRFGKSGGAGMVGLHNFTNIHNHNNFNNHNHGNSHIHGHVNNIISPPIMRAKSPANNLNNNNNSLQPKRKKNVEKFLKKFKSNLEDISEQFDEKLGFTDEEINHEDSTTEMTQLSQILQLNHQTQSHISEESLSPTNTINNFAADEEEPDSLFYSGEPEFICIEKAPKNKKSQISMISRLLKKDESVKYSLEDNEEERFKVNVKPEPVHQIPAPKFLYSNNDNSNNSDSFINNQLELMAANRYDRFTSTSLSIKSPKPKPSIQIMGEATIDSVSINNNRRVIDANALSTSLSANKFKLEEEFDSQIVIW